MVVILLGTHSSFASQALPLSCDSLVSAQSESESELSIEDVVQDVVERIFNDGFEPELLKANQFLAQKILEQIYKLPERHRAKFVHSLYRVEWAELPDKTRGLFNPIQSKISLSEDLKGTLDARRVMAHELIHLAQFISIPKSYRNTFKWNSVLKLEAEAILSDYNYITNFYQQNPDLIRLDPENLESLKMNQEQFLRARMNQKYFEDNVYANQRLKNFYLKATMMGASAYAHYLFWSWLLF